MKMRIFLGVAVLSLLAASTRATSVGAWPTLEYFGQACFLLTTSSESKIVIDPHGKLEYPLPKVEPDIITASHEHFDHNNVGAFGGNPAIFRGLKEDGSWNTVDETVKGIHVYNVGVFHDSEQGAKRGRNTIFIFEFDGLRLAHLGDLGHVLDDETIKKVGALDFLLIPVGGYFTINAEDAWKVAKQLNPKVIVPMHFKTGRTQDLPIQTVDPFLKGIKSVRQINSSKAELKVPKKQEVWVFKTP